MRPRSRWVVVGLLVGAQGAAAQPASPVCVVRAGWSAIVTPEEVRDALALRLPGRDVSICDDGAPDSCSVSLRSTAAPEVLSLTVACGEGARLRDQVAAVPRDDVVRRVAVEAAALLGVAPPSEPEDLEQPPLGPARPVATVALPSPRVAAQLRAGSALAPELPGATFALVVDLRWFVVPHVHFFGGAKLAGRFEQTSGGMTDSVADRAFWLGAGYRAEMPPLFIDVALAGQYTVPILRAGDGGDPVEEFPSSRFAFRGSVEAGWRFHPALAVVVEAAASMSVRERDVNIDDRDGPELGFSIVDVTVGLQVELR